MTQPEPCRPQVVVAPRRRRVEGRDAAAVDEQPVRVMVVDDQPAFRRAAASVIELTDGFVLVAQAHDGTLAVSAADEVDVDLVLMDVNMPGIGGVAAARELVRRHPDVVVALVSTYATGDLPTDVLTSGRPYLRKEHLSPDGLSALWRRHRPGT